VSELREHAPRDELTCCRTWSMGNVKTLDRRRVMVCNRYLPSREVVTAISPVV
jgi:hypothetical protein